MCASVLDVDPIGVDVSERALITNKVHNMLLIRDSLETTLIFYKYEPLFAKAPS